MSIDKRITHRRNFKGGADMGTVSTSTRAATNKGAPNVSAGGASFNDLGPSISGRDTGGNQPSYERSRNQFIDNLNKNNASRFEPSFRRRTYKPVTLDTVGARNQRSANPLVSLLGFMTGIPFGLFNQGKSGLTSLTNKLNNLQGDFREKFTGYRTQQEYDDARQQRINLKRINTIQNTLDRKYSDGDYSNTDLDERLANLKASMGIVPNTAEQNAQQFLDFGNELAENTQQTIFPAPIQNVSMYSPEVKLADAGYALASPDVNLRFPESGINTLRFPEFNPIDTQVTPLLGSSPKYAREIFFPYSGSV